MSIHHLREALRQPGCAICRLRDDAAEHFVHSMLWEGVTDAITREELRRAQGFCAQHAWHMVRKGASLGSAIVTRDLLEGALNALAKEPYRPRPLLSWRRVREWLDRRRPTFATARLVEQLSPRAPCPACAWAARMETLYVQDLLRHLLDAEGLLEDYRASDGLCLPHLRLALAIVRDEPTFQALVEVQASVWQRLVAALSEFIRKSDHRFRCEPLLEGEGDAWLRAIAALVGPRPDPTDQT